MSRHDRAPSGQSYPFDLGDGVLLSSRCLCEQLDDAIAVAARYDSEVMIERFVRGRELTVSIVGDTPLPPVEIRSMTTSGANR